jgi:hypothetical protein
MPPWLQDPAGDTLFKSSWTAFASVVATPYAGEGHTYRGSPCEANQHDTCGPGRICDLDGIFKIKPGPESCTRTPEFCQLGSICNPQGVCECLDSVAEKSDGCPEKPGTNRTFSNCTPPTDPGMVTDAVCKRWKC